jgi:hypothetical protein
VSNLDWPRGARACDGGAEEREALALKMRRAHERAWAEHESVKTLLRRHYSAEWERVKACRMDQYYDYKVRTSEDQANLVMLRPQCRDLPFCPACNDVATHRRASGMIRRLRACTPKGKMPRAYLVTIGVSPKDGDRRLIELVSSDVRRFKRAVYRAIERLYGKGIGALVTYQHYGQDILVRSHPHVHALVNGWRLGEQDEPIRTPMWSFADGGKQELMRIACEELDRAFPEAGHPPHDAWMNGYETDIQPRASSRAVAQSAKYMAREIIDFRDFEYDPRKRIVYVTPYKQQGPGVLTVPELQRNLSDYNARYQPWAAESGRRVFDGAYGELSDRSAGDTAAAMGSIAEHREGCWCRDCSDWSRVLRGEIDVHDGTLDDGAQHSWG